MASGEFVQLSPFQRAHVEALRGWLVRLPAGAALLGLHRDLIYLGVAPTLLLSPHPSIFK